MTDRLDVAVVGLGEVGRPILELLASVHRVVGIDLPHDPLETYGRVGVVHICFPYEPATFVEEARRYGKGLGAELLIVNTTVAVGTTRAIEDQSGIPAVHSPVRGKHHRMKDDLLRYRKYIGGTSPRARAAASVHFESIGMKTLELDTPEATELAKLTETAYFGLLIAWAQELERYCDELDLDYDEVAGFFDEIPFFPPVRYFPGVIGGHCVIPNLDILSSLRPSRYADLIRLSNQRKIERESGV